MSDVLLRMLAKAQDAERSAIRRGEDDVLRLVRNQIRNLEELIVRRGE